MAVQAAQVTVGTTATLLSGTDTDAVPGLSVAVQGPSGATVYLGGADVTTATGWPVAAGATFAVDLRAGDALYAVVASGTVAVPVLRTGT